MWRLKFSPNCVRVKDSLVLSLTDVALVIGWSQSSNLKMSHVERCPNAPLQSINGNEERYCLLQCVTTDNVKR